MPENSPEEPRVRPFNFDLPEEVAAGLDSLFKGKTAAEALKSIAHAAVEKASQRVAKKPADVTPPPEKKMGFIGFAPDLGIVGRAEMTWTEFQARIDAANLASGIISEIMTAPDRAAGIVGSAFVEDGLAKLMTACWISQENVAKIKDVLDRSGPLGSFSAKISVAYLSKMIGPVTYGDLDKIRDIRNHFAHFTTLDKEKTRFEPVSFDHAQIIKICEGLQFAKNIGINWNGVHVEHGTTARNTFVITVVQLGNSLHSAAHLVFHGMPKERLSLYAP